MFLIDDALLAPFRGLMWIVEKIDEAARDEMAGETAAITERLRALYLMLESGQVTEAEFDEAERHLLDRLDAIRARDAPDDDSDGDQGEDDDGVDEDPADQG
jgi:hypothetical protein